jgi:D-alanyl-D-alanine carboxypeptidase/D-alanyl-D-alanine-endopeptidase (penicillin-binding protein 4)
MATAFRRRACFGLIAALLLGGIPARAQIKAQPLPAGVVAALRSAGIPAGASAIVVRPLAGAGVSISANAETPMNPASTMKLVTTYVALNALGPGYAWRTEAWTAAPLRAGALEGDLVVKGSGDPKLVIEDLWLFANRLRAVGLREIRGDLVLDKSAFAPLTVDPAKFDGEATRPYNAAPDALLLNFKAQSLRFLPDSDGKIVHLMVLPALAGQKMPATVKALDGPCGDWKGRLQADFSDPMAPTFRGGYPLSCGEKVSNISLLTHTRYFGAAFRAIWESVGGTWAGTVRDGAVPTDARLLATHESAPLPEVVRNINKFSNNVMARQLFLTLGKEATGEPANPERATRAVHEWLASHDLAMPELVLENGSGLSRIERISAGSMARLLVHAWASPLMPEFIASLPLVGVDGTMRKRNGAAGDAHIKSGSLSDVRAIAGYVLAASGRRYAVVAIINHANAGAAQSVHDSLLQWVYQNG